MLSHSLPTTLALTFALGAFSGCARAPVRDGLPMGSTLAPPAMAVSTAKVADEEEVEPTGALVIRDDVLDRCPRVKELREHPDDDSAVDAIRGMGDCMTRGALRNARIVVRGGDKATRLFNEALARVGVPEGRVEKLVADDDEADSRVEIALSKKASPAKDDKLVLSVRKSQVVGFLITGSLDD